MSKSSVEAEYRAMSLVSREIKWLHCFQDELGYSISSGTPLYGDSTSVTTIASNPVIHERTKSIEFIASSYGDYFWHGI